MGRMGLAPAPFAITVGGTNGKGSTCAYLECILRTAGYRTGLYTSPHLVRYNERVRLDGEEADDEALARAFRPGRGGAGGDTPLTYFEFGTLAAFAAFEEAKVEVDDPRSGAGGPARRGKRGRCRLLDRLDAWTSTTRHGSGIPARRSASRRRISSAPAARHSSATPIHRASLVAHAAIDRRRPAGARPRFPRGCARAAMGLRGPSRCEAGAAHARPARILAAR